MIGEPTRNDFHPGNQQMAEALRETAVLLEAQGANPFRVRAYRQAAETIAGFPTPLWQILESQGVEGMTAIPTIGRSIAGSISHMVRSGGKLPLLERLRGEDSAERLFTTIPSIGPQLAQRIHEQLGVETLWELEAAAMDGRLAHVEGMGEKRLRAVRESLTSRFHRPTRENYHRSDDSSVSVDELLDVDRQYREAAAKRRLPRVAPRRFNPTAEAWLPILHTERGPRHYTALFSNTARAHQLGTIHDWVVIYRDDQGDHGQWTVITSNFGKLRGCRIVRGREDECADYYARQRVEEPSLIGTPSTRAAKTPRGATARVAR